MDADRRLQADGELHPHQSVAGCRISAFPTTRSPVLRSPRSAFRATLITDSSIATFSKCSRTSAHSTASVRVNDFITLTNKFRDERSVLNYIGTHSRAGHRQNGSCNPTAAISPIPTRPTGWSASIRRAAIQVTNVLADQASATIKFDTGPVRNTVVTGAEISRETGQHRHL